MLQELFATLKALLSDRPELAIFAALIVGYADWRHQSRAVSARRRGGHAACRAGDRPDRRAIDPSLQRFMFTLFIYALGLLRRAAVLRERRPNDLDLGPAGRRRGRSDHRRGIRRRHGCSSWMWARQAGCWRGRRPNPRWSAPRARRSAGWGWRPTSTKAQQANVATAYALSYIFSLITIVLFASQAAPRLLRHQLARRGAPRPGEARRRRSEPRSRIRAHSFPALISRGFRVAAAAGKTVAAVEAELGGDATIESVRRGDAHDAGDRNMPA